MKLIALDELQRPGAIRVEFQPIVSVDANGASLYAFEALTRGPRETSMERPDVLFEYARRKGVETQIDLLCIAEILKAAEELPKDAAISINVHGSTLTNVPHFAAMLGDLAARHHISTDRLMLEIVEHRAPWSMEILRATLDELRAAHVRIAVDDLGVAASNYRMVVDCRPDHLKIDRYVVSGCSDDSYRSAVLRSIVTLAQHCGATPIAEGIENRRDLEVVLELGINKIQGWLYGRSMPASQVASTYER